MVSQPTNKKNKTKQSLSVASFPTQKKRKSVASLKMMQMQMLKKKRKQNAEAFSVHDATASQPNV